MHSQTRDPAVTDLNLARVEPCADLDTEPLYGVTDRRCAADRSGGPVEGGEEPVAGGIDLLTAEAGQLVPHDSVMSAFQFAPALVAHGRRPLSGTHNVRE